MECELYLAESTIPGSGLGIFSAVEKKVGDKVGNGDVAFPLMELSWHTSVQQFEINFSDPFADYQWDGISMGMGHEVLSDDIHTVWPGIDCAINSLIPLENVMQAFPKHLSHGHYIPYMPHRAIDPGAGAISTYRASETVVKRDIPPGGELFKNYGDRWFTTRPEYFGEAFPVSESFGQAERLIEKYSSFKFLPLYEAILDIRQIWRGKSRTLNALPETEEQLLLALEHGIGYTYQRNATRSLDWLQEHGTCIDNIVHRESTIPGAGEGGFAKRDLPKGTVVTGSPLLIIPDESLFDMHDFFYDGDTDEWMPISPPKRKQIIFNYCLGHEYSGLLLFPYGAVGAHYINHNSSKANVKIQWAADGKLSHDSKAMELTPREFYKLEKSSFGLGIEYIALADISEGEELFLDYGHSWEEAWQRHVDNWIPPMDSTSAADWNEVKNEPFRTNAEQKSNPYPENIELRCHMKLLDKEWKSDEAWIQYEDPNFVLGSVYGLPCAILERTVDGKQYTVELHSDELTFVDFEYIPAILRGVPREAIFFLDAPYQSDLYLENAFRHHIRIPEDMMPKIWRNKQHGTRQDYSLYHEEL